MHPIHTYIHSAVSCRLYPHLSVPSHPSFFPCPPSLTPSPLRAFLSAHIPPSMRALHTSHSSGKVCGWITNLLAPLHEGLRRCVGRFLLAGAAWRVVCLAANFECCRQIPRQLAVQMASARRTEAGVMPHACTRHTTGSWGRGCIIVRCILTYLLAPVCACAVCLWLPVCAQ